MAPGLFVETLPGRLTTQRSSEQDWSDPMRRIASSVILALAFGLLAAVFAYPSSASDTPSGALAQSASPDQASDDSALLQIIQTDMARAGSGHFGVAVKHLPT